MRVDRFTPFLDFVLGPCVRRIPSAPGEEKTLYLTFDDGPDPVGTPRVLSLLREYDARATFFVVGRKAQSESDLLHRIQADGHGIGNHSDDHGYRAFFAGVRRMKDWVARSESRIERLIEGRSVGFRSPAGVRTPELRRALRELSLPHVLWAERFYDSTRKWSRADALASLATARDGDIVLLHDAQKPENLETFLDTLRTYLDAGRAHGFLFRALRRDLCTRRPAVPALSVPPKPVPKK